MNTDGANPFPGLRPFEREDSHVFFGRDELVGRLIEGLSRRRLMIVAGPSRSGKSSCVRAGLIPALLSGFHLSSEWRIAVMRPGVAPFEKLAHALAGLVGTAHGANQIAGTLRRSSFGLVDVVRETGLGDGTSILVVVDQFEEIFRYATFGDNEEQQAFVQQLLVASTSQDVPVFVVMTVRSDFLSGFEQFRGLPEALSDCLLMMSRMTRSELQEAIVHPAEMFEATISAALVSRLLNEFGEQPDQLALFQHALRRTWDQWKASGRSPSIDLEHYESIGTISGALELELDSIYTELPNSRQPLARTVLLSLVERLESGQYVRRPTPFSELCAIAEADPEEVRAVLAPFAAPAHAFVLPSGETVSADTVIDFAQETIISRWPRLRGWVQEEQQSADIYIQLASAAARHGEATGGYYRNPELARALAWIAHARPNRAWAERYHPGFDAALRFLDRSRHIRRRVVLWSRVAWSLAGALLFWLVWHFNLG